MRYLGSAVLLVSGAAQAGEWTITPLVDIEQSITDNARSASEGEEADLITTATAGLSIRGVGRRAQFNFDYDISQDKFWDNNELDGFRQSLLGAGDIELVEDFAFVDTRASISQQSLNRNGGDSASDRSVGTNDQTTIVNFSVTPNFAHRYGNWAESDIRYTYSETQFLDADVGSADEQPDASRSFFIETLVRSGPRFNKFKWELSGSTTFTNNESDRNIQEFTAEYAWSRHLALLGGVGRETIENSGINEDDSAEFFWSGGFRLTPGPRSLIEIEYSNRFDDTTMSGEASYRFSPLTTLRASYSVSVQTDREAFINNLNNLVLNDEGELINPDTGQPGSPNDSDFDFLDQTTRQENFSISLNGASGRNTFGLFSTMNVRKQLPGDVEDTVVTVGGNIDRRIWPNLDGGINATYSTTTASADNTDDITVNGGAFLRYRIQNDFTGNIRYNFIYRDSDVDTEDLEENVISFSIRKTF